MDNKQKIECLTKELIKTYEKLQTTTEELEKWKYYAQRDDMTEILNRREGMRILTNEIEMRHETKKPLTICFIDIDKLKEINDKYGHIEGNQLICAAVNIINDNIRKYDIVFRYAGDEFIIIFPNTSYQAANEVWNRISQKIQIYNTNTTKYKIGLSYGLTEYPQNLQLTIDEYIKLADQAMYRNKKFK